MNSSNKTTTSSSSFEQVINRVEKEYGLDSDTEKQQQIIEERFHNVPFWRWELPVKEHYELYRKGRCNCFNCKIKWPVKNGHVYPLFDYQQRYLSALEKHKLVACIKCRASGISEVTLRYMEWLALKDRKLAGSQFICVSAPAEELTLSFMRRIRAHLEPIFGTFETKERVLMLNGVRIETMPSHNLLRLRGITNVSFLALEESSFWHQSEEEEILPIILPLRQKNEDIKIALISTPGEIGSLMYQIHLAPPTETPFHKVYIPWQDVVGKLFTREEIEEASRTNAAFEREMNLTFGYATSNVFNPVNIEAMIQRGEELRQLRLDPNDGEETVASNSIKSLGVDPGYSSSRFAIVMTQLASGGIVEVVDAQEYEGADFNEMIEKIVYEYRTFGVDNIYVDSSQPELVKPLKTALRDTHVDDYLEYQRHLKSKHRNPADYMKVVAVSFREESRAMLAHVRRLLDGGALACSQTSHSEVITSMMGAHATEGVLEKKLSTHNDVLDALMLACKHFSLPALSTSSSSSSTTKRMQAFVPPPPPPPICVPMGDSSSSSSSSYRMHSGIEGSSSLSV